MAESKAEFRDEMAAPSPASAQAAAAADRPSGPGPRAGLGPSPGTVDGSGLGPCPESPGAWGGPPGLARGWVVVAPGGVPPAAGEPLAALLAGLRPPRRWLASGPGAPAGGGEPAAAGVVARSPGGEAQSSRKSSDSGLVAGAAAGADPPHRLAALAEQPGAWLWPLPVDPGAFLGDQGSWAEALGAWRQPCLLLIPAAAAATGPAAAYHALLMGQGVPLIGLIQWGGPWLARDRRRDGLPWLGWLADPQEQDPLAASDQDQAWEAAADLARALQLASPRLDLD